MQIFFFYAKDTRPQSPYAGEISWFATIERSDEGRILKELAAHMQPLRFAGSCELIDSWVNDMWGEEIDTHGYVCLGEMIVPAVIRASAARQDRHSSIPNARRKT